MKTNDPKAIAAQDRSVLAQLADTERALERSNARRMELCDELHAVKLDRDRQRMRADAAYREVSRGRVYRALCQLMSRGGSYESSDQGITVYLDGDSASFGWGAPGDLERLADQLEGWVQPGVVVH